MKRDVVVTGIGVVSACGFGAEDFFASLMAGRSGIGRLQAPFADQVPKCIAAQVDFDPTAHFTRQRLQTLDRFSQFALLAAGQAVVDAGLQLSDEEKLRSGVYFGTGVGGTSTVEEGYIELLTNGKGRVKPFTVLNAMGNAAAAHISLEYGLLGPTLTYSTACSSSTLAVGEGARAIRHGYADIVLAGGSEALLTMGMIKSWESLRTLAVADADDPSASCKPFDANRSGLVLGEGGVVLVLEEAGRARARGARIYGEIIGYGAASDGTHLTRPDKGGQIRAMRAALVEAGVAPEDIGYLNAHGTATIAGDAIETEAIKEVFGEHAYKMPVSATKSLHGHMMGATGAAEFAVALLALHHSAIPPTANLRNPDPTCDLDYVPLVGRTNVPLRMVMSNSFAFGGSNAVLIARGGHH